MPAGNAYAKSINIGGLAGALARVIEQQLLPLF